MKQSLSAQELADTEIKTPFEKMRANAIINAAYDTCGLSIISFNISAFLQNAKSKDAYFLLRKWAVAPLKRQPHKFRQYPQAGYSALIKRMMKLDRDFAVKQNIPQWFADNAVVHMRNAIDQEMNALLKADNNTQTTEKEIINK